MGLWKPQPCAAPYQQTSYYSPSPQSKIPKAAFHHMQTVQVNSLNKHEDNRHIQSCGCQHNVRHMYTSWTIRWIHKQGTISCPCKSIGHCLQTRNQSITQFSSMDSDSPVKYQGSCPAVLLGGNKVPQKAVFQVTDTRGYLILGHETVKQIGYIQFPSITLLKLTQPPRTHAHLKATTAKAPKHKKKSRMGQDLRHPNIQLIGGAVVISGKKNNLPLTKWYMLKKYNVVLSGIGTLPQVKHHSKLKKDYILVQLPPKLVSIKLKHAYKGELQWLCSEGIIMPVWMYTSWINSIDNSSKEGKWQPELIFRFQRPQQKNSEEPILHKNHRWP